VKCSGCGDRLALFGDLCVECRDRRLQKVRPTAHDQARHDRGAVKPSEGGGAVTRRVRSAMRRHR
jgi:hypothetical protein